MISFKKIMKRVLTETMSFRDLLSVSDPKRKERAGHVKTKSLGVTTMDDNEAWTFSYKSEPDWNTTGNRWRGYIRFLKENVKNTESAEDLDCMVDCTCPDYRFRWAYRNAEAGVGALGPTAWNQNNGQPPKTKNTDLGIGACKHLIALGEYLKTKIEPTAPEPPTYPTFKIDKFKSNKQSNKTSQPSKSSIGTTTKQNINPTPIAPEPSPYSDTKSGTLFEQKVSLFNKIKNFVNSNSTFNVNYNE